jgi:4-amino-4-deoxychorismate lyase
VKIIFLLAVAFWNVLILRSLMHWYDGKLMEGDRLPISIADPGLLYGATVFTTLRVYGRSLDHPLTHWLLHCDRLCCSLESFGWRLPNWERVREGAQILLAHYPVLRITIFCDGKEWIVGRSLPSDLKDRQQTGIAAWLAQESSLKRSFATHKTGNYLSAWMALQKAQKLGAQEAILLDERENWLETSTGNLWGWKAGCWWTPKNEENFLSGIVRAQLLQWLQKHHAVCEVTWTPDFVRDLDAIAYSNSVVEIIPFFKVFTTSSERLLDKSHPALDALRSYFLS